MDRLNQLRGDAGASRDSTLDTSSLQSEAYLTANESSKYFSLSEDDSTFGTSPSKEVEIETTSETMVTDTERIISNLSPNPKKNELDGFKIGEQIEAANILSGGVNIFDDNENSYDEDELVIDDAVQEAEDKSSELKLSESNEIPYEKSVESSLDDAEAASPSKDSEVVLQIDGKNVDAIDIGNGLYLYRKDGEEELAAVQIMENEPNIKFLKVRENAEGNLEVYEEIEVEVSKEVPIKEGGKAVKNTSQSPVKDVNKVSEAICNKVAETSCHPPKDSSTSELQSELNKDVTQTEPKSEVNVNGKMMKFSESRKSPLIGTFTPMTYHSTPNKEGIPLTKTMVDLQLQPSRHSENVKKTIEVHTDHCKQRLLETPAKNSRISNENNKSSEITSPSKHKGLCNESAVDKVDNVITIESDVEKTDVCDQETNKHNSTKVVKNSEEKIAIDVCNANIHENVVKNLESTSFAKDNLVSKSKDDKTELSTKATQSQLEESLPTTGVKCKLITIDPASEIASKERNLKDEFVEKDNVSAKIPNDDVKPKNVIEKLQEEKGNVNETCSVIPSNSAATKMQQDEVIPKNITENLKECIKSSEFDVQGDIKDNRNLVKEVGKSGIEDLTKTGIINPQKEILAHENKKLINIVTVSNEGQDKKECPSEMKIETAINIEQNLQSNAKLQSSYLDVKTKDIIDIKQSENSAVFFPKKDNTTEESDQEFKVTEREIRDDMKKPFETYHNSLEKNKLLKDIDINESKNESVNVLKIAPTDMNVTTKTLSESPVKSLELLEDVKKGKINQPFNVSQGSICKVDEKKNDSLMKQPNDSVKVLQNAHKDLEAIMVTCLEEQCKEPNTDLHKNDTKIKVSPIKSIEAIGRLPDVEKNTKLELKKKEPNKEHIPENEKIGNAEVKQLDNSMVGKSTASAIKLAPNNDLIVTQTDLLTTEKNPLTNTHNTHSLSGNKTSVCEPNKNLPVDLEKNPTASQEVERKKVDAKKETVKVSKSALPKPINNNKAAVPFGKWTEANRQEFLNKIKEAKIPTNTSNTKQLKQPNDLNRRDVLQKIDSQRQSTFASAKVQELNITNKNKNEQAAFINKSNLNLKEKAKNSKVPLSVTKAEETVSNTSCADKAGQSSKTRKDQHIVLSVDKSSSTINIKKDPVHRKEINNQDLIDKTIEGIINRAVTAKLGQDDPKHNTEPLEKLRNTPAYTPVSLDEIESKMNELHGIPFVERPPHELPKVLDQEIPRENKNIVKPDIPTASKNITVPKPFPNKPSQQKIEEKLSHPINREGEGIEDSDEDVIEHEPVTADSELIKNKTLPHIKDNLQLQSPVQMRLSRDSKKETIITENDFDKFARRNSITYENCLTVNFDGKEQHNVVQSVIEKEVVTKKLSRNEIMLAESKAKSNKHLLMRHNNTSNKVPIQVKSTAEEDSYTKNYQSKVQIAYNSAMTAKRQQESPITIIEDKPVKVVFMDSNHDFVPQELILQGKELSPPKKTFGDWDHFTHSNSESMDSDVLETGYDSKSQDEIKSKSKHQRKQVLAPVEAPELELIEPGDLGIEVSPKKKRKIEDNKLEKTSKALVPKKSYLLNRNILPDETTSNPQDLTKTTLQEPTINEPDMYKHSDTISAIDNLVKAAELIETQSENKQVIQPSEENSLARQNTPIKRGRGRPRKYPLPDTVSTNSKSPSPIKTPIPQKKPRLIDAKIRKIDTESEDDDISSDGELVKENWTMGKINENIVCPICNKLFRSENVVFKHVKHCTGPSPSRSDSDKRSPRRGRQSQELDWKSEESKSDSMDIDEENEIYKSSKKRKSKDKNTSTDEKKTDVTKNISIDEIKADAIKSSSIDEKTTDSISNASVDDKKSDVTKNTLIDEKKTEVIVIEDTPVKESLEKHDKQKDDSNKATSKTKLQHRTGSLICEFCGKTFRQLSYLVNHKLQHKNKESKKLEKEQVQNSGLQTSLFSCEVCKKEFRKLHHLVQHRIIHNPNPISSRSSRKSSSEQSEGKAKLTRKPSEDQSAGFRCEPCDKSFRKLHHLVEHRETHDEMNKKCVTATVNAMDTTKLNPLHNCDVCKKSFKKLQHLMEHKEHHVDTSSEKSDDKSVKSSLSTKDIIHECPLCYMVFPNEHSLNKHNIICQRKKKQSAAKNIKKIDENNENDVEDSQDEEAKVSETEAEKITIDEKSVTDRIELKEETQTNEEKEDTIINSIEEPLEAKKEKVVETEKVNSMEEIPPAKPQLPEKDVKNDCGVRNTDKMLLKTRKHSISTQPPVEIIKIPDTPTPKKKLLAKEKTGATVTKRQKTSSVPLALIGNVKHTDSSDDDEVRYMLNPDFVEQSKEGKMFIKVRAKKRNSLQIERPNSKDLVKRRISLQHPPKIPRLKVKPVPRKPANTSVGKSTKSIPIPPDPVPSSDSDDSDVKYSFPVTVKNEEPKEVEKKAKRQMIVEKRKTLGGIAKRKSMGKMVSAKHKINTSPAKQIKRRTKEVEHRCDCGALFSSAAMLARHASLAHTPPRIRRRRSPPPDSHKPTHEPKKQTNTDPHKPTHEPKKQTNTDPHKPTHEPKKQTNTDPHKPKKHINTDSPTPTPKSKPATRKSSDAKATSDVRQTPRAVATTSRAHKGVPVPEKMRKLLEKSKK